jgi:hypothetical protein
MKINDKINTITIRFNNMPSVTINRTEDNIRDAILSALDCLPDSSIHDIDVIDVRDNDQLLLFPDDTREI